MALMQSQGGSSLCCTNRANGTLPQNPRNAQKLLAEKSLPQIARIYTDLGGYGILPYSRSQQHPKTSVSSVNSVGELTQPTICVDQCNPWENCIPTERTEPTEASCREGSPTDCTLSLQKNATQSHKLQNDQGKTMIAKDSFVPLL